MGKQGLGRTIRALRRARDVTQAELAVLLGVSPSTVAMWETEKRAPDLDSIDALARALGVTPGELIGSGPKASLPVNSIPLPAEGLPLVRIIGSVRCGPDGLALEDPDGYETANVPKADEYFYLRVVGDSMEPQICEGDLALVHRQEDVESGELAVVVIGGEEGTLKRVVKRGDAVALQAFNPAYSTRIFTGPEMSALRIAGRVVETKRKW